MDQVKIGQLIRSLRLKKGLTQMQTAQSLGVSDKAVSKWERGLGCPDVSLLAQIAELFQVSVEGLLQGELNPNDPVGGNMKKLQFYVCPVCGNLLTATAEASVSCCGKLLSPLLPRKAAPEERLSVETIENDYYITSEHEMTKAHYVSFVALLTGDTIMLRRLYPEWNLQARIPCLGHGMLVWYCTRDGLFTQPL